MRLRDARSEFRRLFANLLVKCGAYKVTRNPEYPADGDEEERGVREEDFVVEFDGLVALFYRFEDSKCDLKNAVLYT